MGSITNKIYIYTSIEKNVVENIDWDGLSTEEYNGKTYYKIPSGGSSSDVVKKITFETFKDNVTVTLNIVSSSESRFDFAYACELDGTSGYYNAKYEISGNNKSITHEYVVPTKGKHWIYIGYRKDSSGNYYNDCGYFNIDLPEEKVIFSGFKQPNNVYLASNKMKEITYGNKKVLESGFNNTISWETLYLNKTNNNYTYNSKGPIKMEYTTIGGATTSKLLTTSPSNIPFNNNQVNKVTFYNSESNSSNTYIYKIDLSDWDTSYITKMNRMFKDCEHLVSINSSEFNTSNVTDMSDMFNGCKELTSLDVSNWNTSNVTDMSFMFGNCKSLTSLDVSKWDVSSVTSMYYMFFCFDQYGLTKLDVSNWDVSNVTNMYYMFYGLKSLTKLDVSKWDVSSATGINAMFGSLSSIKELDVSKWNVSSVTDMGDIFSSCSSLTELDLSRWDVSMAKNVSGMFHYCRSLTSLKLFDFSKINSGNTDIYAMFNECTNLVEVDLSGLDTSNFKYKYDSKNYEPLDTFYRCASLERICPDEKINENPDFAVFKGLKDNVDLSSCSKISLNSVYAIINSMTNITTSKTLKLNYVTYNKLSPEWIKKATDKGWSVTK